MKKIGIFIFCSLFLFACGGDDDPIDEMMTVNLITPNVGITQINLGDDANKAFEEFGSVADSWSEVGGTYYHFLLYLSDGVTLYLEPSESEELDLSLKIIRITVASPYSGETAEGIKIGSTKTEVKDAYGEPDSESMFFGDDYDDLGLTIVYTDNDTVEQIELE